MTDLREGAGPPQPVSVEDALEALQTAMAEWMLAQDGPQGARWQTEDALTRSEQSLIAAVRADERARVRAMVEREHRVILRDVERWGWNVQKSASAATCEVILAAIDAAARPEPTP